MISETRRKQERAAGLGASAHGAEADDTVGG
jgi:hypothetical protein